MRTTFSIRNYFKGRNIAIKNYFALKRAELVEMRYDVEGEHPVLELKHKELLFQSPFVVVFEVTNRNCLTLLYWNGILEYTEDKILLKMKSGYQLAAERVVNAYTKIWLKGHDVQSILQGKERSKVGDWYE